MKDSATNFAENPLYEKLYNRFSYSGMTVGEMMLSRARESASAVAGQTRSELHELTTETCITRANSLPRRAAAEGALPSSFTPFSLRRVSPASLLAFFLSLFILSFLVVSGIRQHQEPGNLFLKGERYTEELYAVELDSDSAL